MSVHILGIRHHGPGSARSLLSALTVLRPDIILIEGPPEGQDIVSLAAHPSMKPPVSLICYTLEEPLQSWVYPFTSFSPEWNAIQYGAQTKTPVQFIDMPLAHQFALAQDAEKDKGEVDGGWEQLSSITGFDSTEAWWEHTFEMQSHPLEVFAALTSIFSEVRADISPSRETALREAFMRRAIRTAVKEGFSTIAVVCGAFHAPALESMPTAKADAELVKNLPKVRVATTWIPWTNDRLLLENGYGAGVESPGWYQHLWDYPDDRNGQRWAVKTADVFRRQQMDISTAHVIETVTLASSLAALRNKPAPSLEELTEATQAVMCLGDPTMLTLVRQELIVGTDMGIVPEETPQVPLQRDFHKHCKSLRLSITNIQKDIVLDLRSELDLKKSAFLHRTSILVSSIGLKSSNSKGTFKEVWSVLWSPTIELSLIEKARFGNSIEEAAAAFIASEARSKHSMEELSRLIGTAILANLGAAVQELLRQLDSLAASSTDIASMMGALPALFETLHYGNVRNTDKSMIASIVETIFYRISAGLEHSCHGIAYDEAQQLTSRIRPVHTGLSLLQSTPLQEVWFESLARTVANSHTAGIIHGVCTKILYDSQRLSEQECLAAMSKALSLSGPAEYSAQWVEGFFLDGAHLLLYDTAVWSVVQLWLNSLSDETFIELLPMLRRTFEQYEKAEKEKIAQKIVKQQGQHGTQSVPTWRTPNPTRSQGAIIALEQLLFPQSHGQ